MQYCMFRHCSGCITAVILLLLILVSFTGCSVPEQEAVLPQSSPAVTGTPAPAAETRSAVPVNETVPATPAITTVTQPAITPNATPVPTSSGISESAVNARIVDARNKLSNLIDSNVADTVIIHPDGVQGCEVKESRELGFLIDLSTGESTFVKGDYWSIDTDLFTDTMRQDHRYIIIHTQPKIWETCAGTGIFSYNTFSVEDLGVTANLTRQGYHIRELIAIADNEYRIRPGEEDGWKSRAEILVAIKQIETRTGRKYSHYSSLQNRVIYDLDNLMPLLAKELGYHYTVNNVVIS
jgi:hypothetical protein